MPVPLFHSAGRIVAKSGENGKPSEPVRITELTVEGFKSIEKLSLPIKPLTILAGANSSGKSSAIQPILLLKQTLEATYDPGPLLLNGPNVSFTEVAQFVCKSGATPASAELTFGFSVGASGDGCHIRLKKNAASPLELLDVRVRFRGHEYLFQEGEMKWEESPFAPSFTPAVLKAVSSLSTSVRMKRNRFLIGSFIQSPGDTTNWIPFWIGHEQLERAISEVIHVPGLRGNPLRNYPISAVGSRFTGTFEKYVASIVVNADKKFIDSAGGDLLALGLTWKVEARRVDDTQVEIKVGRLPKPARGGANDLVSIADVGFGVSQTLPVVVALLAAKPGQFVYIEQPEIHLHPRAQVAMAGLLARAANRGVQVVIETHSSLLLLGVQRLVATGEIDPAKILLHWFNRDEITGLSNVTTRELDEAGRFGDWPEDFDDVTLEAQQSWLDAAEQKLAR